MKKLLFFMSIIIVFAMLTGCKVVEEREAVAEYRPDRYWENVWVVQERISNIDASGETLTLTASCIVTYEGDEPAEDVNIVMRSPLTRVFIGEEESEYLDIVNPGEELRFSLQKEVKNWQEEVPAGVFEEKIIDDFQDNSYVGLSWSFGEEEHDIRMYDWGVIEHWF